MEGYEPCLTLVLNAVRQAPGESAETLAVLNADCGTGLCGPLLRPSALTVPLRPRRLLEA